MFERTFFFLFVLFVIDAEQSELICSHQPIMALAGDDVILPCHLEPPIDADSETVLWTRTDLDPKYIHVHQDGGLNLKNQNPSYHYRTRLFVDELPNGNVSMKIFKVKLSDAGKYFCLLPSMQKKASIQLTVGESEVTASKTTEVRLGEDAILPCNLTRLINMQSLRVEWTRNEKDVHLYRNGNDDLHDQDKNFEGRTSLFCEEMASGNISLKLTNVTEQDSGIYTCFVYAKDFYEQLKECSIDLKAVPNLGMDRGIKRGGISTGAIVAVVVIIAIVAGVGLFLLVKNRRIMMCAGQRGGQQNMEENNDVRERMIT